MGEQAPGYFRAVAVDFDGTLADGQSRPGRWPLLTRCAPARSGWSWSAGGS